MSRLARDALLLAAAGAALAGWCIHKRAVGRQAGVVLSEGAKQECTERATASLHPMFDDMRRELVAIRQCVQASRVV